MIRNKKGLSAIITTLLVVMLVLVAVGIVWVVVSRVIRGGAEDVEIAAKCLHIDVRATAVNCASGASCNVTFERTGTNNDAIAGVKLVFRNSTIGTNSGVRDLSGNVEKLLGRQLTTYDTTMTDTPDSIEVTAYFEDASGNEKSCAQTTTFTF